MIPAAISRTSDSATSQTISTRRVRTPTALSCRPPSFSASFRSERPARNAGSPPARTPVRIDTPTTKTRHGASMESRWRAAPDPRAARHRARTRASHEEPGGAAGDREHERLDQHLLEDARAAGAERGADGELFAPRERASEQQVGDVRAGDQEHEGDGGEEHDERHPHVADDQLLQRHDDGTPPGVGLGILLLEALRDRVHLRLRLPRRWLRASRAIT